MNTNLSQLGQQLLSIWKQLGVNQRLSVTLAAGIVIAGLASLVFWTSRPDYALLYGKLDDAEAAKVIAALDDAKVPYQISRGGGSISVPADKVHVMRMQMAAKGIPRGDGVGFEIFDKSNFGISDFVQRANYLRAVQGELSRTISQVDVVESARVMIVMPENRLLLDNQKRPTASVFVRVRGNANLPSQTVNAIRFLVANSVEGLQANHVTVVDNLGNVLSENNDDDSITGLSSNQLNARKNLELYLSKKVEGMLDKVLGPGQSVVRVSAEINFDSISRTEEKFDPDGAVLRYTTINDENVDSISGNGSAPSPGIAANSITDTNQVAGQLNNSSTRKKVTNSQYEINKTTSSLIQAAGGLRRVSAAVFVASRMEGAGAERKAVPRTPEEMDKLRRIVQSALGVQEGVSPENRDEITLEEMPFNGQPAFEITEKLEQSEKVNFWTGIAKSLLYPAAAFVVLMIFWRSFKRTPSDDIPIGVPVSELIAQAAGNHPNGKHTPAQPVTVDVLNQLLKENPHNMTEAIRAWLVKGRKNN